MPIYQISVGSSQFSFVHVHIPKTGGVSISHFFTSILGARAYYGYEMNPIRPLLRCHPHHYHYPILNELFLLEEATSSFCIVRNPLTRIKSDYVWAMTKSTMKDRYMSFDDWVSHVFDGHAADPYFIGNHIRPQHEFIGPKIRHVLKFEDGLETAIRQVLAAAGIDLKGDVVLDRINTRDDKGADKRLKVTMRDDTRAKIVNFYREDFERFDYLQNV